VGYVAGMREKKRNTCRMLAQKPEGTRPFGTPKYRWDDNIKMHLK
jgi:hypothetical protein